MSAVGRAQLLNRNGFSSGRIKEKISSNLLRRLLICFFCHLLRLLLGTVGMALQLQLVVREVLRERQQGSSVLMLTPLVFSLVFCFLIITAISAVTECALLLVSCTLLAVFASHGKTPSRRPFPLGKGTTSDSLSTSYVLTAWQPRIREGC